MTDTTEIKNATPTQSQYMPDRSDIDPNSFLLNMNDNNWNDLSNTDLQNLMAQRVFASVASGINNDKLALPYNLNDSTLYDVLIIHGGLFPKSAPAGSVNGILAEMKSQIDSSEILQGYGADGAFILLYFSQETGQLAQIRKINLMDNTCQWAGNGTPFIDMIFMHSSSQVILDANKSKLIHMSIGGLKLDLKDNSLPPDKVPDTPIYTQVTLDPNLQTIF